MSEGAREHRCAVPRPSLGVLASAALGAWGAAFLGEELCWRAAAGGALPLPLVCAAVLAACALAALATRRACTLAPRAARLVPYALPAAAAGCAVLWQAEDPLAAFTRPAAD